MPGPEAWPVRGEDLAFSNSAATRMGAECVRPRCRGILPSDNGVSKCNILTPHWPRLGLWHIGYVPCTIGRDRHHIASPKRLSRYRYGCIGSGITCRIGSTRGGGAGGAHSPMELESPSKIESWQLHHDLLPLLPLKRSNVVVPW